ncbi:MAG: cation:proton antiporter [Vampirovibrionales bacterium]|nr:cation:proton antiporter [Vampirovibrionales bacterium]
MANYLPSPYAALSGILTLGLMSQWLSWRFALPSILLLLLSGMLAGQMGFINPDLLFGDLLRPIVSFSVAIILFEGSLSLKFKDLTTAGLAIRNLASIGVAVTWILSALAAYLIFGVGLSKALLIAAILTVTGPTVIMPMLRYIRPSGDTAKILRWEGIINDPIGSLLAIIVFEAIQTLDLSDTFIMVAVNLLKTIAVGGILGLIVTKVFVGILRREWIPVYLQSPMTLMVLLATFVVSNEVQKDSGLFTVTLMGIIFANQKKISLEHIIEFKENLGLILLSSLFILLAARLHFNDLLALGWNGLLFLLVMITLVRPASVFLSTIGTNLTLKEKVFLSGMAPRGIVAAAISSVFALRLDEAGFQDGQVVAQIVFLTILGTVIVYASIALPLAKALQIAGKAKGVLILGAHSWARQLAELLKRENIPVLMVDRNVEKARIARMHGFNTYTGSILSERTMEDLDLTDYGQMLALLSNAETNALATIRFQRMLGADNMYQLYPDHKNTSPVKSNHKLAPELRGKIFLDKQYTYNMLEKMLMEDDYQFKSTTITQEFDFEALRQTYKNLIIPVCLIVSGGSLQFATSKNELLPKAGQKLIFIAPKLSA